MKRFKDPETGIQYVSTKDLYIAAFYMYSGLALDHATADGSHKVTFFFEDGEEVKALTALYFTGESAVDPATWMSFVNDLKDQCRKLNYAFKEDE